MPVITLYGDNPTTVTRGVDWVDPGAKAIDDDGADLSRLIEVSGTVDLSTLGTYTRTYTVTGDFGTTDVSTRTVIVEAPPVIGTKPVITLNPPETESIIEGDEWTDPGATAFDADDGDLTPLIKRTNSVNTSAPGVYYLYYDVRDSDSNDADTKTRTITVTSAGDTTPPKIKLIESNFLTRYLGDAWTDPGATASDNADGDITLSIAVTGTVDTSKLGTYQLYYNVSDASGNAAEEVVRTVWVVDPATIGTFPDIVADSEEWGIEFNTEEFRSSISRILSTHELPGAAWQVRMSFTNRIGRDAKRIQGFLVGLKGKAGRFWVTPTDWEQHGTVGGSGVVEVASNGDTLKTEGWDTSQPLLFATGDYFEINGELKKITADIATDIDGKATLYFSPPMRNTAQVGMDIRVIEPRCLMHLMANKTAWQSTSPMFYAITVEGVEALDGQ